MVGIVCYFRSSPHQKHKYANLLCVVIFNKEAVHCPHAGDCYCKQYGMCDRRDCDKEGCPGQYHLPKYSNLPQGWPMIGWDGEDRHWSGEL